MTLVSLPAPILYPGLPTVTAGPGFNNESTLDAAGEYIAYIFSAKEDMTVSHIGFSTSTVAGSPTCTVGIEALDASGFPSGSAGFGSTNGTTATLSSNSWVLTALGGSATISKGSFFAVKIAYASGTSVIVRFMNGISQPQTTVVPYKVTNTGTPTKGQVGQACIALGSSSTTFYHVPMALPVTALTGATFNNTNSAKRGLRFIPPMNCRAIGVRWYANNTTGGNYNIGVYTGDASGTELSSSSTAIDGDNAAGGGVMSSAYFDSSVTLTAGTAYRVAIEPTSATNVGFVTITLPSSDYYGASPGGANSTYTALASGTWTDSTTQIPTMDVILDQVDDGTGSGSGGGGQRVISG